MATSIVALTMTAQDQRRPFTSRCDCAKVVAQSSALECKREGLPVETWADVYRMVGAVARMFTQRCRLAECGSTPGELGMASSFCGSVLKSCDPPPAARGGPPASLLGGRGNDTLGDLNEMPGVVSADGEAKGDEDDPSAGAEVDLRTLRGLTGWSRSSSRRRRAPSRWSWSGCRR